VYRFTLQVVLDYRKRLEEALQIDLSGIERDLAREKQQLISYEQEKRAYEEELARREAREVDLEAGILYRDYLRGMRRKVKAQRDKVATVTTARDKKREELLIATKKRKVLETVRQKDFRRFLQGLERRERLFIDEISIRNYGRGVQTGAQKKGVL